MSDRDHWKLPRPPLQRLCSFNWTSSGADWGGVFQFQGVYEMDSPVEYWELLRVMPARIGGTVGDIVKTHRATYEAGGLRFWRSDLIDPVYSVRDEDPTVNLAINYRAAERAVTRVGKAVEKTFKARMRELFKKDNAYLIDELVKRCPVTAVQLELIAMHRENSKKSKKGKK